MATQQELKIKVTAQDNASSVLGRIAGRLDNFARNADRTFGEERSFRRMMRGGMVGVAGDMLSGFTGSMVQSVDALREGKATAIDMVVEMGKGLPILGGFVKAGLDIASLFSESARHFKEIEQSGQRIAIVMGAMEAGSSQSLDARNRLMKMRLGLTGDADTRAKWDSAQPEMQATDAMRGAVAARRKIADDAEGKLIERMQAIRPKTVWGKWDEGKVAEINALIKKNRDEADADIAKIEAEGQAARVEAAKAGAKILADKRKQLDESINKDLEDFFGEIEKEQVKQAKESYEAANRSVQNWLNSFSANLASTFDRPVAERLGEQWKALFGPNTQAQQRASMFAPTGFATASELQFGQGSTYSPNAPTEKIESNTKETVRLLKDLAKKTGDEVKRAMGDGTGVTLLKVISAAL